MGQIIISTGNVANDGLGSPLRNAFNDVNYNFTQLFNAGPYGSNIVIANNTISVNNTNGNLILATNGVGSIVPAANFVPDIPNVRSIGAGTNRFNTVYAQYINANTGTFAGNVYVAGNLQVTGNVVTVDYSNLSVANSNITLATGAANAAQANGGGLLIPIAGANLTYNYSANSWNSTIAITAPTFIGDGSNLTNVIANIQANALLGNTFSNSIVYSNLTSFGLVTNLSATGNISTTGNVYANTVIANTVSANYIRGDGSNITNITANAIVGNVPFARNANSAYTANLAALATQAINADTALFAINANLASWANTATIAQTANASHYAIQADNANSAVVSGMAYELSPLANLSITGNITTGGYFIGNGSQLTGISTSTNKIFNGNSYANINSVDGNLEININGPVWSFNADGSLQLPIGSISYPYGPGVVISANIDDISSSYFAIQAIANITGPIGYMGVSSYGGNSVNGVIETTDGTGNSYNWNFGSDGRTFFPNYTFPTVDGATGETLTTDGAGTLSWSAVGGNYGNANVADYLPVYTGNLSAQNIYANGGIFSNAKVISIADSGANGIAINGAGIVAGANIATILYDNSVFGWTVNQGWLPAANVTYNLGRSNRYWNNFYAVNVNATDASISNSISVTNNINAANISATSLNSNSIVYVGANGLLTTDSTFTYTNKGGELTLTVDYLNSPGIFTNDIYGQGNLILHPSANSFSSYLDVYLTTGPDIHIAANSENIIIGRDSGANVTVGIDGNVTVRADTGTSYNWTFESNGALTLPSAFGPGSTAGWIQTANAYPTLIAYGSVGHGGPELDWSNSDDPVVDFSNASILRHTLYLNGTKGLYVGFNETGNVGPYKGNFQVTTDGNVTIPTQNVNISTGAGEAAKLRGARKIVNGVYTGASNPFAVVLPGDGSATVVYATEPNVYINSAKVTFAVQGTGVGANWEQFDVVFTPDYVNAGQILWVISNRIKANSNVADTIVTVAYGSGSQIEISLQLPVGQNGWASFDAVEFGLMVD